MTIKTKSLSLIGLNATTITVEVDAFQGLPAIVLVGLATKAVNESKDRITSALRNCNIKLTSKRIIINLSPADVVKSGSHLDLAIALGIIQHFHQNLTIQLEDSIFLGELALDGQIEPVKALLPMVLAAKKQGFKTVYFPEKNVAQVKSLANINLIPVKHLEDFLTPKKLKPIKKIVAKSPSKPPTKYFECQIYGQTLAKRALEVAAAGRHNLLLIGAPGVGKSLLAKHFIHLLPILSPAEKIEITSIHSLIDPQTTLISRRPFRAPHHNISQVGLLGGGSLAKPGEISLAHHGVLFLDELPEFSKECLEGLRQPLQDKKITVTRAKQTAEYPANFQLIATANPCPCGYYFDQFKTCTCSVTARFNYFKKISGPILDRIDLVVFVEGHVNISSQITHKFNLEKINEANRMLKNSESIKISPTANAYLNLAYSKHKFSLRVFNQVQKVAQTICALEGKTVVTQGHMAQALQFKPDIEI